MCGGKISSVYAEVQPAAARSSAHRNDLDVWAYVDDVLRRLLDGETDYEPLLPWNRALEHPDSVRQYRKDERRDKEARQRKKREKHRAQRRRSSH